MKEIELTEIKEASGVRRRLIQINFPQDKLIFGTPCKAQNFVKKGFRKTEHRGKIQNLCEESKKAEK